MRQPNQPLISELYKMVDNQTSYQNESKASESINRNNNSLKNNSTTQNYINTKSKHKDIIYNFLLNEKNYEQKKTYKQFCHRNQLRLKELNSIQTKPHIDHKSEQLVKKRNIKPLYTRANQEVERQLMNLELIRHLSTQTQSRCKSPKSKKQFHGYHEKTLTWINTQEDWRKKKERNIHSVYTEIYDNDHKKMKSHNLTMTLPFINRNKNSYLHTFTLSDLTKNSLNLKKKFAKDEMNPSFFPILNRNRSEKSKLFSNNKPIIPNQKRRVKSTVNKSKSNSVKKTKTKNNEHWTKVLLNLSRNSSSSNNNNESLYKVNICPTGAWNENCINYVNMNNGKNLGIIKRFIQG